MAFCCSYSVIVVFHIFKPVSLNSDLKIVTFCCCSLLVYKIRITRDVMTANIVQVKILEKYPFTEKPLIRL